MHDDAIDYSSLWKPIFFIGCMKSWLWQFENKVKLSNKECKIDMHNLIVRQNQISIMHYWNF
jgi:hypothetical protein